MYLEELLPVGTNVQQYKFNGSDAQRWFIKRNDDNATFSIYSRLRNSNSSTYQYALDISGGSSDNYANLQIYEINGSDAQKFSISLTKYASFVFFTKISNNSKAIVLNGPTLNQGGNIDQYTFQNYVNEMWILEPVARHEKLGVYYAETNFNQYVNCYPKVWADCTNFTSQCLLAGGMHYTDEWKIYKLNDTYQNPANPSQLDASWELIAPKTSPWLNAPEFTKYIKSRNIGYYVCSTKYALEHPEEIMNLSINKGDIIQVADGISNTICTAKHSMYVSSTGTYNGKTSFTLCGHQEERLNKNLMHICEEYPNDYLIFIQTRLHT